MSVVSSVGRPRVYGNRERNRILAAIKRHGSMLGAQRKLAGHASPLDVSMAVIKNVAAEAGLKFKRGRNAVSIKTPRSPRKATAA